MILTDSLHRAWAAFRTRLLSRWQCTYCARLTRFSAAFGGGWCPVLTIPCCRDCYAEDVDAVGPGRQTANETTTQPEDQR